MGKLVSLLAWVVLLLAPAAVWANLSNFSPAPFSHYWEWGERRIKEPVAKIEDFGEFTNANGTVEKRKMRSLRYAAVNGGGYVRSEGPEQRPHAEIVCDADGRTLRVVSRGVTGGQQGQPFVPFTKTEAATYDQNGRLASLYIEETGKPNKTIVFKNAPMAGGGQTMTCTDNGWDYSMDLNAAGQVTSHSAKKGNVGWTRGGKRNTQGDVVSIIVSRKPIDEYEYEYDERGNWIRRTRYPLSDGKRGNAEIWVREIQYGNPGSAHPDTLAAKSEVTAKAPEVQPDRLPGEYVNQLGKAGEVMTATMTVSLATDKTATFASRRTFREQVFEDKAVGKWSLNGKVIVVSLEKSTTERPLPPEMRTLRFVSSADGDLVAAHNANSVFKRSDAKR